MCVCVASRSRKKRKESSRARGSLFFSRDFFPFDLKKEKKEKIDKNVESNAKWVDAAAEA